MVNMKRLASIIRANGDDEPEEEGSSKPTQKCTKEDMIKFLKDNPNPSDDEFHEWAEGRGFDVPSAEAMMYELATMYVRILEEGKADDAHVGDSDVDPKELEMGKKVELEHIDDEDVAKEISLDHLAEMPNYYSELKKMEEKVGRTAQEDDYTKYLFDLISKYLNNDEILDAILDVLSDQEAEDILGRVVQTHDKLSYERGEG